MADSTDNCFIEIIHNPPEEILPEWIECYIIENLDPKCCGPLARDLNAILPLRIQTQTNNVQSTTPSSSCITEEHDTTILLPNTEHLKRIRRRPATDEEIQSRKAEEGSLTTKETESASTNEDVCDNHPTKKAKKNSKKKKQTSYSLDILVGSVSAVDYHLCSKFTSLSLSLTTILERYNLSTTSSSFIRKSLPGRPAHTKDELNQWNTSVWPTLFYEEKTAQYKEEQLALTIEEVEMMKKGLDEALKDALAAQQQCKAWREKDGTTTGNNDILSTLSGVVVLNPQNGVFVSKASDERNLQAIISDEDTLEEKKSTDQSTAVMCSQWNCFPDEVNPLCTPVLLAIQGVSRQERQMALGVGMESEEFKRGQVSNVETRSRYIYICFSNILSLLHSIICISIFARGE